MAAARNVYLSSRFVAINDAPLEPSLYRDGVYM
jgi:hypothetical protein